MTTQTPQDRSVWPRPAASRPPHESSYGYFDENGDFILYRYEQSQEPGAVEESETDSQN